MSVTPHALWSVLDETVTTLTSQDKASDEIGLLGWIFTGSTSLPCRPGHTLSETRSHGPGKRRLCLRRGLCTYCSQHPDGGLRCQTRK